MQLTDKNARRLGYVVHLFELDEFLVGYTGNDDCLGMMWSPYPHMALIFNKKKKAQSFVLKHKPEACCCELLDLGDRYMLKNADSRG